MIPACNSSPVRSCHSNPPLIPSPGGHQAERGQGATSFMAYAQSTGTILSNHVTNNCLRGDSFQSSEPAARKNMQDFSFSSGMSLSCSNSRFSHHDHIHCSHLFIFRLATVLHSRSCPNDYSCSTSVTLVRRMENIIHYPDIVRYGT